jgi:hypothetical protein
MPGEEEMKMGIKVLPVKWFSILLLVICAVTGCANNETRDPTHIRVGGASDVIYLAAKVKDGFSKASGLTVDIEFTQDAVRDLKQGKIDVALVGRELSQSEQESFEINTVAFDAVCILIDQETYQGGVMTVLQGDNISTPVARFKGLHELSLEELRQHYRNILYMNSKDTPWTIPGMGIYNYEPYLDPNGYAPKIDPQTNTVAGTWVFNTVRLQGSLSPVGRFDTQQFLLQKLGLDNVGIDDKSMSMVEPYLDSEELWISSRYSLENLSNNNGSNSGYNLFLIPASREVTLRAIQHGFGVKPLMIDGVNPLSSSKTIYDGSYPLSRKIYALVKTPVSVNANRFVNYLLTPDGQQLVEKADFLPVEQDVAGVSKK